MIDDDPLARSWMRDVLRHHVSELLVAEDGEQAWQLLQAGARPAICFCDVAMPGMDGLELLHRIRDEPLLDDLPFILLSATVERDAVDAAAARDASAYLLKPFLSAQAHPVMASLVRKCRLARSEHFLVTLRRTGVPFEALEHALRELLLALRLAIACRSSHCLIHPGEGALHLGLYRCARLMALAGTAGLGTERRRVLLRECAALVEDQLREMGALSPDRTSASTNWGR
ncbi:response regulator [Ramlibacter sp. AN1133]|uniref:response regulator n=1 Tax=Ramlibacter sp. AN1133 TaxID=3133429 RepID=UPI0030BAB039